MAGYHIPRRRTQISIPGISHPHCASNSSAVMGGGSEDTDEPHGESMYSIASVPYAYLFGTTRGSYGGPGGWWTL